MFRPMRRKAKEIQEKKSNRSYNKIKKMIISGRMSKLN